MPTRSTMASARPSQRPPLLAVVCVALLNVASSCSCRLPSVPTREDLQADRQGSRQDGSRVGQDPARPREMNRRFWSALKTAGWCLPSAPVGQRVTARATGSASPRSGCPQGFPPLLNDSPLARVHSCTWTHKRPSRVASISFPSNGQTFSSSLMRDFSPRLPGSSPLDRSGDSF